MFNIKILISTVFGVILGYLLRAMVIGGGESTNLDVAILEDKKERKQVEQRVTIEQESALSKSVSTTISEQTPELPPLLDKEGILAYLTELVLDYSQPNFKSAANMARAKIQKRLDDSPELALELLDALIEIDDESVKHQLRLALWTSKLGNDGSLESMLVERIDAGDRAGEYLQLLGMWGVRSRAGLNSALGQLQNNPDPTAIRASMQVLNTTLATFPLAMSPKQREDVANQIRIHLNSFDERLRGAALESLVNFPQDDIEEILLNGFDDPSAKVRVSAINSYSLKPFSSADIRSRIMTGLQDDSKSYMERTRLVDIATSLDLSENEQEIVNQVNGEAQRYFSELSEEELRELSKEFE